jgi:hypothetical protein
MFKINCQHLESTWFSNELDFETKGSAGGVSFGQNLHPIFCDEQSVLELG